MCFFKEVSAGLGEPHLGCAKSCCPFSSWVFKQEVRACTRDRLPPLQGQTPLASTARCPVPTEVVGGGVWPRGSTGFFNNPRHLFLFHLHSPTVPATFPTCVQWNQGTGSQEPGSQARSCSCAQCCTSQVMNSVASLCLRACSSHTCKSDSLEGTVTSTWP